MLQPSERGEKERERHFQRAAIQTMLKDLETLYNTIHIHEYKTLNFANRLKCSLNSLWKLDQMLVLQSA